jgi:hypothetical protein
MLAGRTANTRMRLNSTNTWIRHVQFVTRQLTFQAIIVLLGSRLSGGDCSLLINRRMFMSDSTNDPKLAKAEAKAAAAKAKALRPWFKKKRFIVPIALVVIIGLSQAMNGGGNNSGSDGGNSSSENSTDEGTVETRLGIGDKAVDGKFSFTVTKVTCGIESVGSDLLGAEAQGQFCQLDLEIENVGDEPQTMFADNQKVFDVEGREFSADTSSMFYLEGGSDAWLKEINPGNTLTGSILFDVPADASLDYVELHDSAFSGGVEVSLK